MFSEYDISQVNQVKSWDSTFLPGSSYVLPQMNERTKSVGKQSGKGADGTETASVFKTLKISGDDWTIGQCTCMENTYNRPFKV